VKKLAAISLVVLLLFNLTGYHLFFQYIQFKHERTVQASIDNNTYEGSKLIQIKVPLNMPYLSSNKSFEKVEGCITIDGRAYKYVKRKIENGQLVLSCLADDKKTSIDNAKTEFGYYVNDIPTTNKKGTESIKKATFDAEYEEASKSTLATRSIVFTKAQTPIIITSTSRGYLDYTGKPPENFFS